MTCRGCRRAAPVSPAAIDNTLARLRAQGALFVSEDEYADRMAHCRACAHLLNGDTCRVCGCLLPVRARLADKGCPGVEARW